MKDLNLIISTLNFLGLGGLGIFIYYMIKGLRERVSSLTKLAEEQKITLDVVKDRASESDKLNHAYKKALVDFQDMGEKLELRRQELIKEQEFAIKKKDDELAKLASLEIQELDLKEKSLKKIPELEKQLESAISQLKKQMRIAIPSDYPYEKLLESGEGEPIPQTPFLIVGRRGAGKTTFINKILSNQLEGEENPELEKMMAAWSKSLENKD